MPAAFQFPKRGPQFNGEPADVSLPLVFNPFERQARGMFYNHSVIGRLRDGMTAEQAARDTARWRRASRELSAGAARLAISAPDAATPIDGRDRRRRCGGRC